MEDPIVTLLILISLTTIIILFGSNMADKRDNYWRETLVAQGFAEYDPKTKEFRLFTLEEVKGKTGERKNN